MGKQFEGIEVISPLELNYKMEDDIGIYVASMYYSSIYKQLVTLDLQNKIFDLNLNLKELYTDLGADRERRNVKRNE